MPAGGLPKLEQGRDLEGDDDGPRGQVMMLVRQILSQINGLRAAAHHLIDVDVSRELAPGCGAHRFLHSVPPAKAARRGAPGAGGVAAMRVQCGSGLLANPGWPSLMTSCCCWLS